MMEWLNLLSFAAAALVVTLCFDRLRQINWATHKARYVATPLMFLLWGLFLGAEAVNGQVDAYQLFAAGGALTWLLSTHKTWSTGSPEYSRRIPSLKPAHYKHVGGGRR